MKFVVNRQIALHSTCNLSFHLQSYEGAPLSDIPVRIQEVSPSPEAFQALACTDAGGNVDLVVSEQVPTTEREFQLVLLGPDGLPNAEPIAISFPAGEAHRLVISAIVESEPDSSVPLNEPGTSSGASVEPDARELRLDPRLAADANISVEFLQSTADEPYWKLVEGSVDPLPQGERRGNLICRLLNEDGSPANASLLVLESPRNSERIVNGPEGWVMPLPEDSVYTPERGEQGIYSLRVEGERGDRVVGLGIAENHPADYGFTWQRVVSTPPLDHRAESSITGRIAGAPNGTYVILTGDDEPRAALLGPGGIYAFNRLLAGSYTLTVTGVGAVRTGLVLDGTNSLTVDYEYVQKPADLPKNISHYMLFGPAGQRSTVTHLILALDYILRYQPVVGFSAEEARAARHVSLVGNTEQVSAEVEEALRHVGYVVHRISAPDSYALENRFKELVASGSPYPSRE